MLAANLDAPTADEVGLASVDLVVAMLELLAGADALRGVSEIAQALGTSKARTHRHLRALLDHGFVRQDSLTGRYGIGIRLLALGEAVRDRFDVLGAARPEMALLREATGQAVTFSSLVGGAVTILELMQGKTLIEFGVRPGATLDFHTSAHGKVALAFAPPGLRTQVLAGRLHSRTPRTITDPAALAREIEEVTASGWATAPDQVLIGVNTLAAPVFDYQGAFRGSIAIVGSTQFITSPPDPAQLALVVAAAKRISTRLGGTSR